MFFAVPFETDPMHSLDLVAFAFVVREVAAVVEVAFAVVVAAASFAVVVSSFAAQ